LPERDPVRVPEKVTSVTAGEVRRVRGPEKLLPV
jgi:hypothetical protein